LPHSVKYFYRILNLSLRQERKQLVEALIRMPKRSGIMAILFLNSSLNNLIKINSFEFVKDIKLNTLVCIKSFLSVQKKINATLSGNKISPEVN